MSGPDFHSTPNVQAGLLINRLLYEGRGDELIDVVSDLVQSGELKLSEGPLRRLLETVRSTHEHGQKHVDGHARD